MNHTSKELSGSEDGSHIFEVYFVIHVTELVCLQYACIHAFVKWVEFFFLLLFLFIFIFIYFFKC